MIAITTEPIDAQAVEATVHHPGAGAVLTFSGVTRDNFDGRSVTGLHYDAYVEMAESEMAALRDQVTARWPGARVAMVHRIGALTVGEVSVVISVSAPHRDEAYQASRFAIDELKAKVPIWKKEHYADGNADWKANKP